MKAIMTYEKRLDNLVEATRRDRQEATNQRHFYPSVQILLRENKSQALRKRAVLAEQTVDTTLNLEPKKLTE